MLKKNLLISVILAIVFSFITYYVIEKSNQDHTYLNYNEKVYSLNNEISELIEEKKTSNLNAAIKLSKDINIIKALENNQKDMIIFDNYTDELKDIILSKKIWIQIIDKEGNSFYRNWSNKTGDNLLKVRTDIKNVISSQKIVTNLSVGKYDLTFKTIVPIFNNSKNFIGVFEIITHFDTIINYLEKKNISSTIIIDKLYKQTLTEANKDNFVNDYYLSLNSINESTKKYLIDRISQNNFFENDNAKIENNRIFSYKRLFGNDNKLLGYIVYSFDAKDIDDFKSFISNTFFTISGFFILYVFTLLAIYIITNKNTFKTILNTQYKIKMLAFLFSFYILILVLFTTFLYFEKETKINEYLNEKKKDLVSQYNLIKYKNKMISNLIFDSYINTPEILSLLEDINKNPSKKDINRKSLLKIIEYKYPIFKKYGIKQLHFHLPNNESFLRVHKPNKYGDNLTNIRPSVKYVNDNLRFVETFEEGRIYNGYRYVYPLFSKNFKERSNHLGSVEISINMSEFLNQLSNEYNNNVMLLLDKKVVDEKIFEKEKYKYLKSDLKNFYYENNTINPIKFSLLLDNKQLEEVNNKIRNDEVFAIKSSLKNQILLFLPIKNQITNNLVGTIVTLTPDTYIKNKNTNFITVLLFVFMFFTVLLLYLYKEINNKINIQEQNKNLLIEKEKIQKVLNSQDALIIVTDGEQIFNCNETFLKFFGVKNLDEYLEKFPCICCLLKNDTQNSYLCGINDGKRWDNYIISCNDKIIKAKLINKDGIEHIFRVRGNYYTDDKIQKVISFTDITDIELLQRLNNDNEIKLMEQSKMAQMGEMIANIAHQWRQPLSAISSSVSSITLQKDLDILTDEDLNKYISLVMKNISYLSETIETFRNFAKDKKELKDFDLVKKIQETIDIVNSTLKNYDIDLEFNHPKELIMYSISAEITQVFMNLINNARDVLVERDIKSPKIIVNTYTKNENVILEVIDNAGGIDENIIYKIFDLYFTTKHQSQGTGLGLHMCKEIVIKNLKGDISVTNEKLGAKFTIKLPIKLQI